MTLRAKGARKRQGNSPRRKEEGTVTVCPEAGRERRLMYGHLGAPTRAAVNRERRAPVAAVPLRAAGHKPYPHLIVGPGSGQELVFQAGEQPPDGRALNILRDRMRNDPNSYVRLHSASVLSQLTSLEESGR